MKKRIYLLGNYHPVLAISIAFSSQTENKILFTCYVFLAIFVVNEAVVKAIITEQEIADPRLTEYAIAV